jgi:hypothetical protein
MTHSFLVTGPMFFNFSAANAGASGVSLISGGNILYNRYGVTKRPTIAGKLATFNHNIHGFPSLTPISSANFRHNRFCAAAVKKRALELPDDCQAPETNKIMPIIKLLKCS